MAEFHAVVWLDHLQALVFHFNHETETKAVVHAHLESPHLHTKSGTSDSGKHPENQPYYRDVAKALAGAKEILVIGPSTAKLALLRHIAKHDKPLSKCICGQKTADHMNDSQIVNFARQYFKAYDNMALTP